MPLTMVENFEMFMVKLFEKPVEINYELIIIDYITKKHTNYNCESKTISSSTIPGGKDVEFYKSHN
ncbi:2446_t:CDS:1, partial [Racocetra persica]